MSVATYHDTATVWDAQHIAHVASCVGTVADATRHDLPLGHAFYRALANRAARMYWRSGR